MKNFIIYVVFVTSFLGTSFFVYTAHTQKNDPAETMIVLETGISKNIVGDKKMKEGVQTDKGPFQKYREANQRFHRQISNTIDFDKLSNIAMPLKWRKKYWKGKPGDYKLFIELLQDLIEEIVYPRAKDFYSENKIRYLAPRYLENESIAEVPTVVELKGDPDKRVDLIFRLVKKGSVWKIYDVSLEGEWWTDNFKGQFNHIITTKSYNELIEKMKKKLKNVQEGLSY